MSSVPSRVIVSMIAVAASTIGVGSAALMRSWSAIVSVNVVWTNSLTARADPSGASRLSRQAILHDVGAELRLRDLERLARLRRLPDLHRVVLPQRIAVPVFGHQQPARIGMVVERDAEQVPHFALQPVGGRPDDAGGGDVRVLAVQPDLHAEAKAVGERNEEIDQ